MSELEHRLTTELADALEENGRLMKIGAEHRDGRIAAERALARYTGSAKVRAGGPFRRRPGSEPFDPVWCTWVRGGDADAVVIRPTRQAKLSGLARLRDCWLPGETLAAFDETVRAESWWHLCSILGVTEFVARCLYIHPESDQPSATAAVPSPVHERRWGRSCVIRYSEDD